MRHFNWYITKNLLGTLLLAMGILAFVMLSVHFFRAFSMLASGVSPLLLGKILLYLFPDILRYVLPLSLLVATVLVYSRMSADNEITAMKASGISIWQMVAPGVLLSVILCILSLWLGLFVSPELRYKSEQLRWQALSTTPLALIEPGSVTRLSDTASIRVGTKDDNGVLYDVHYLELDSKNRRVRDITAATGILSIDAEDGSIKLILHDFTFTDNVVHTETDTSANASNDQHKSVSDGGFLSAKSITIPIHYASMQDKKPLVRKNKMMPALMLLGDTAWLISHNEPVTKNWMEFHHRLALGFSPLAFMLLGIPFGIRNKRSGNSSGLLICVVLALVFYGFSLLSGSLVNHPALHPEYIIWLPNILYQLGGLFILAKLNK